MMPKAGMRWRHCVIGTFNSWLPGDPRGFRSKDHKVHSSGDYKNRPPVDEHAGLYQYSKSISGAPVIIPRQLREVVGERILEKLRTLNYQVLAIAVAGMHAHFLVELPDAIADVRHIVGQCKSVSSHAIRDQLPGRVWAHRGKFTLVDDAQHQRNTFRYILDQEDAWIWSYKDRQLGNPQGSKPRPGA
jgi:REP element-mobilizing transposase RayT